MRGVRFESVTENRFNFRVVCVGSRMGTLPKNCAYKVVNGFAGYAAAAGGGLKNRIHRTAENVWGGCHYWLYCFDMAAQRFRIRSLYVDRFIKFIEQVTREAALSLGNKQIKMMVLIVCGWYYNCVWMVLIYPWTGSVYDCDDAAWMAEIAFDRYNNK